jgi:pimeloyl-ACP methyl ester carboxylesterase
LHGLARGWQSFLPLIPTLALRWQVYALDQRGHGKSERANSYFAIDYVPDIVGFLRHEIRRPTVLYGHSLGAMVAAAVAAEAIDLVRAIILEDPNALPGFSGFPIYKDVACDRSVDAERR